MRQRKRENTLEIYMFTLQNKCVSKNKHWTFVVNLKWTVG